MDTPDRPVPPTAPPTHLGVSAGDLLALADMALAFGRVLRHTRHPDGVQAESDTDHTIMLALIACSLADREQLDVGLVAQYAIVHDLPEVYADDTNTMGGLTDAEQARKDRREAAARQQIRDELGDAFPWLCDRMEDYEAQADEESRFVWAIDKALPSLTNALNGAATSPPCIAQADRGRQVTTDRVARRAGHLPTAMAVLDLAHTAAASAHRARPGRQTRQTA